MTEPAVPRARATAEGRVFLCTAPGELAGQHAAAEAVLRDLGWEVLVRDPVDGASIEESLVRVDEAGIVLALVGWQRGPVPEPETGGDGTRSWLQWEVGRALRRGQPLLVLMTSEAWTAREREPEARAVVADFRAELSPLAVLFDPESDGVPQFKERLRAEIDRYRSTLAQTSPAPRSRPAAGSSPRSTPASKPASALVLRRWPAIDPPERPWPLFLPYSHPDLFAGRSRELTGLLERLGRPQPVVALYAASGAGKSSLLAAGLVPRLRAAGRAVALDRHPDEPGIAARLIGDLLDGDPLAVDDADHATFVERLLTARRRALDAPPVLVLDQFESVLRGERRARAVIGMLLAATIQRRPGVVGAPCRWLLAYRWEFHGELVHWLADPLREARALGFAGAQDLPHDLASPDRFQAWALPTFGTPPHDEATHGPSGPEPSGSLVGRAASEAFLAAITAPLALCDQGGAPRYPWRFEGDGAERLARAFGEARAQQPDAPLVPELQVVLAHLLEQAGEPLAGGAASGHDDPAFAVLRVPEDPRRLIDEALESHLGRALDTAFPVPDPVGRTRALLALRELADAGGKAGAATDLPPQRGSARTGEVLARIIGREGREVLEKLQAPRARLVVAERSGDDLGYVLSHDRLAEVIVRATEGGTLGGRLALDPDLLNLRHFVGLQTELFQSGDVRQATAVSARRLAGIEAHADTLLTDDDRRRWWRACQRRRRSDRRRRGLVTALLALLLVIGGSLTGIRVSRRAERQALLAQVEQGEPVAALAALARGLHDPAVSRQDLLDLLRKRKAPLDALESGLGGVSEAARGQVVLEVADLTLPLVGDALENPAPLASLLWALDFAAGRDPALAGRAADLRERALAPLRQRRAPPATEDPGWVSIPAGTFRMGIGPDEKGDDDEKPAHLVTLSAFRALDHEVTNAEYRRLHTDQKGEDDRPVGGVSWYDAYVYSAWLGGRLHTEAEWEYMARAGCRFEFCREDGTRAALSEIAWTQAASRAALGVVGPAQPVRRLRPNAWGLYDVYGNLLEWTADWLAPYPATEQTDPWSPAGARRIYRGGSLWLWGMAARPTNRFGIIPSNAGSDLGFRPVRPVPRNPGP
ncbi:MAG TPA: SUMF1/EgtB/PvdO family nonheme iron enzyme [Candidatus Polarisedimenticolia bacterium]|nr:SUMF1/EgtB/PvdO family nonheme iron enzyme [Candidatus Polarisedimenticolia bacterium]